MKQNVGTLDRVLRVMLGLGLATQAFIGLATPWAWFAVLPVFTGSLGYCVVYRLLGIDTCDGIRAIRRRQNG